MAEIQVERTRKSSATGWAIILVVLAVLIGAGWYFTMGPGATTNPDLRAPAPANGAAPATPAPQPAGP